MTDQRPTRRDLLKPVQLLGFAFAAAAFGGIIALVSMGFFQDSPAPSASTSWSSRSWWRASPSSRRW
ncbi:MAG: hypothetical protein MIJ73_09095 [Microbacterium aurum]